MILPREEIQRRLNLDITEPDRLMIAPLLDGKTRDLFDADSVDLRLGCHFLLPRTLDRPFFSPDRSSATSLHFRTHVPLGHFLVVPAHQTILGATLEFIKLPSDVSGQVLTKSSVARTFIVVETAPWIHPEYRGCLTLEIANVSNTPVLLYPGRRICQLILMQVGGKPLTGDSEEQNGAPSTYFGPVYPEAAQFKDPEEDLLHIGVTQVAKFDRQVLQRRKKKWRVAKS